MILIFYEILEPFPTNRKFHLKRDIKKNLWFSWWILSAHIPIVEFSEQRGQPVRSPVRERVGHDDKVAQSGHDLQLQWYFRGGVARLQAGITHDFEIFQDWYLCHCYYVFYCWPFLWQNQISIFMSPLISTL